MGIEDINNNPNMIKMWLDNEKTAEKQYYIDNTDSLIPLFEKEFAYAIIRYDALVKPPSRFATQVQTITYFIFNDALKQGTIP